MTGAPFIVRLSTWLPLLFLIQASAPLQGQDWPVYGGDPGGMKYSPLTQINRSNVHRLELAWIWQTGEEPIPVPRRPIRAQAVRPGPFEATPIMIGDTLYLSTPYNRVVALDASTGTELWSYDPRAYEWGRPPYLSLEHIHRGVATWTDGKERRIFINTRWRLIALDARTGKPIPEFGQGGEIDLTKELIWEVYSRLHYSSTSPPVVYNDLVIVGSTVPDYWMYKRNPPGDVQAFDVRTGKRVWSFHTIPQEGEFGNETWEDGSWSYTGSTNVWSPFTLDDKRGLVYLPVSTPNSDFYGGHRKGDNLFAESIVCLDANTGKRLWHFQTVHHGLWDYDLAAPPNLVTIRVDGRTIDAVVVLGKTGFAYVFDRVTGEPVWPIEERPVPQSDVPGERTSPTQPFPTKPPPFAKQGFTEDDVIDFTPELRAMALEVISNYRLGPIFTPPSLEGTVIMGEAGGANWGGAAFDPESGLLYVKSLNFPTLIKLVKPEPGRAEVDYVRTGFRLELVDGLPIQKPPYSVLTAIDLNAGEHAWQVPLGDSPEVRNHPLLEDLELPRLGITGLIHGVSAGPLATRGGLVFVSGGGPALYAIDKANGQTLWGGDLAGARGFANPMTYQTRSGRQFVVIATSKPSGADAQLMAFALRQP
jgi:quinoprotein glucose dehydrogenase